MARTSILAELEKLGGDDPSDIMLPRIHVAAPAVPIPRITCRMGRVALLCVRLEGLLKHYITHFSWMYQQESRDLPFIFPGSMVIVLAALDE